MDEWMLNDLLECSVCLERLDTSSKVLPCQHTFCKKCLQEIVHTHKELRCPECRIKVEVGIDDLPPNVLLMRILEGMRNAPRKSISNSYQNEIKSPDFTKLNLRSISSHARYRSRSDSRQLIQNNETHQPYAIAKCDHISKEPGDLSFKRGDIILLRRQIENNWYQGECNGFSGIFSLSYVQVMVPLPSHLPQCKAMFDFNKEHEDDEGCLHFSKGDIITMTRRIDENWLEGKIDDRIGIFPIAFVEMNAFASNLMKVPLQPSFQLSRDAPPTPTDDSVPLLSNDTATTSSDINQHNTATDNIFTTSPTSSSSSTSTATTSPTSSSESTTPSSPSTSPSSVPPTDPVTPKRHSFTPGAQPPPYHAPPTVHSYRYSTEIMKPEETTSTDNIESSQRHLLERHASKTKPVCFSVQSLQQSQTAQLHDKSPNRHYHRKKIGQKEQQDVSRDSSSLLSPKQINGNVLDNFHRQSSLRIPKNSAVQSKTNVPPLLPAMYIAIYPYKPQKSDEMELKVGCVYTVIERCQDGWYKGTSHPNQKCGVFPGNYVTPVKSLPVLQAQLRGLVHNSSKLDTRACSEVRVPPAISKPTFISSSSLVSQSNGKTSRLAPPELPARAISPVLVSTTSQKNSAAIWHGQNSEACQEKISASTIVNKNRAKAENPENDGGSSIGSGHKNNNDVKNKDKREKCSVSLMRRLTSMKKSKSPPPVTSYSGDNPVFEDTNSSTFVPVAHARSDSCPSQLSYNTSSPHATSSSNNTSNIAIGSQRIKHKQRSSLPNQSRTYETNLSNFSVNTTIKPKEEELIVNHRKSSSLDTTLYDDRLQKIKSTVPSPRERYRCIAPYPPNSDFELELKIGDIIYVHKKREDGWYKGTLHRNGRTGLFPASFVESM